MASGGPEISNCGTEARLAVLRSRLVVPGRPLAPRRTHNLRPLCTKSVLVFEVVSCCEDREDAVACADKMRDARYAANCEIDSLICRKLRNRQCHNPNLWSKLDGNRAVCCGRRHCKMLQPCEINPLSRKFPACLYQSRVCLAFDFGVHLLQVRAPAWLIALATATVHAQMQGVGSSTSM
eukprot:1709389-Rhodomonas_salina.2